jgi:hypothetical protein
MMVQKDVLVWQNLEQLTSVFVAQDAGNDVNGWFKMSLQSYLQKMGDKGGTISSEG